MLTASIKNGNWFSAYINGSKATGRIRIIGRNVFFCQNVSSGFSCREELRYGYKYSWVVESKFPFTEEAEVYRVTIFKKKPAKFTFLKNDISRTRIAQFDSLILPKQFVKVGCTFVPATKVAQIVKAVGEPDNKKSWDAFNAKIIHVSAKDQRSVIVYKGVGLRIKYGHDTGELIPAAKVQLVAKKLGLPLTK